MRCFFSSPLKKWRSCRNNFLTFNFQLIPKQIWDKATVKVDTDKEQFYYRMDVIWHFLSLLKVAVNVSRFFRLSKVVLLVLLIPNSNAQDKHIYPMVSKNKTAFHPNLDPEVTKSLSSI